MGGLARFALGLVATVGALAAVLLVFVFELRTATGAEEPTVWLVDRGRRLRVGDLAVCTHRGQVVTARVAAGANQALALRGNLLFIGGEPVERRPCRPGELEGRARDRCFVERRGERSWVVVAPPVGRTVDLEVSVPAGTVYLLDDDRAAIDRDSRTLGPVVREDCRSVAATLTPGKLTVRP